MIDSKNLAKVSRMELARGTTRGYNLVFPYGQVIVVDAVIIFALDHDPLIGAFGSEGA